MFENMLCDALSKSIETKEVFLKKHSQNMQMSAAWIRDSFLLGGKILICGNGGSHSDAQHFAGELLGRFVKERKGLPAIALPGDFSSLTAIANDYSYDDVFARPVRALARPGDIFFGISTSGNSPNVVKAAQTAKEVGCKVIGLVGKDDCKMASLTDLLMSADRGDSTARIQETHIFAIHCICLMLDHLMPNIH